MVRPSYIVNTLSKTRYLNVLCIHGLHFWNNLFANRLYIFSNVFEPLRKVGDFQCEKQIIGNNLGQI